MSWRLVIPSAGLNPLLLDYCSITVGTQLLCVTTSHASALLLHSATSYFYSVSFFLWHLLIHVLYCLWLPHFALFIYTYFCLPYCPPTILSSPYQGLMGSASYPPGLNAQLGKAFAPVTIFGWSEPPGSAPHSPSPAQVTKSAADYDTPFKNSLPYSSLFSFFKQETCPAREFGHAVFVIFSLLFFLFISCEWSQKHKQNIQLLLFLFLYLIKITWNELWTCTKDTIQLSLLLLAQLPTPCSPAAASGFFIDYWPDYQWWSLNQWPPWFNLLWSE